MSMNTKNHAVAEDFPNYCQRVSKDSLSLRYGLKTIKTFAYETVDLSFSLFCLPFVCLLPESRFRGRDRGVGRQSLSEVSSRYL